MNLEFRMQVSKKLDAEGLRPIMARGMELVIVAVARRAKAAMPRRIAPFLRAIVEDRGPGREIIGIVALPRSTKSRRTFIARLAESGTAPHEIRPGRRGLLRFEVGGRVVFTRRVNHPGSPARPWLQPALDESDIERIMLTAIRGSGPSSMERGAGQAGAVR